MSITHCCCCCFSMCEKSELRKYPNECYLYYYSFRLNDEWIPMDSSRLRIPSQMGKTTEASAQFKEGEKVLARWTDSRKFPGTVNRVLENSMFTFHNLLDLDHFCYICRILPTFCVSVFRFI